MSEMIIKDKHFGFCGRIVYGINFEGDPIFINRKDSQMCENVSKFICPRFPNYNIFRRLWSVEMHLQYPHVKVC